MLSDRLSLALDWRLIALPTDGRIAVFGARETDDLSILPVEQTDVVTRLVGAHEHFAAQGYTARVTPEGPYSLIVVALPRAKQEARRMLAEAVALSDAPIVVDGQKTDGIDGVLRELRKRADVSEALAKSHGKLAVVANADLTDWRDIGANVIDRRFRTEPGVFSADGVDPGSALLAQALPKALKGHVVDLGAGWGYLSDAILSRDGVQTLDLVEADHAALELARENVSDPRARFHWADARTFTPPDGPVDHVVTNPPFHTGRAGDPGLGQSFIKSAAAMLKPRGTLWLVANRHLPYETSLKDAFAETRVLDETSSFKLFQATSPRHPRKG